MTRLTVRCRMIPRLCKMAVFVNRHDIFHLLKCHISRITFDNFDAKLDKIYFVEQNYWTNLQK